MRNQFSDVRFFTRGLNAISQNLEPLSYPYFVVRGLDNGLDEGSYAALKAGVVSLWASSPWCRNIHLVSLKTCAKSGISCYNFDYY